MRGPFCLLAIVLLLPFANAGQAQGVYTQSEIDAAPACGSARDLADGQDMLCSCKARGFDKFIWGTGPYSGHSDLCTAARHAGVITKEEGGAILAVGRPGQKKYLEGEANGIKGRRWGLYRSSFDVMSPSGASAVAALPRCEGFVVDDAPYDCSCPADAGSGSSVWGSGPYTGDSDVCTAARHAGAINADGGNIRLHAEPGQDSYTGSEANGVHTKSWGAYRHSFRPAPIIAIAATGPACDVMPAGADQHLCTCARDSWSTGKAWGSGPYTADSAICAAARHAGVLGDQGGGVNVLRIRGLPGYRGSTAHGVTTTNWDRFETSIMFNLN